MAIPMVKTPQTATLADGMIGAAQVLERAAKRLREQAKTIRAQGLFTTTPAALMRMHKCYDIQAAAEAARMEIGE